MLFKKKNINWAYVFFIVFNFNFLFLIFSRIGINAPFDNRSALVFLIMSISIALFSSLGYFGLMFFSITFIIGNSLALLLNFYLCYFYVGDSWVDLTTIVLYIMINSFSLLLGFLIELIQRFKKSNNEENKSNDNVIKTKGKEEKIEKANKGKKTKKPRKNKKKSNKRGKSKHHRKKRSPKNRKKHSGKN